MSAIPATFQYLHTTRELIADAGRQRVLQLALLLLALTGISTFLATTLEQSAVQTIVFLVAVALGGFGLITRLQSQLADPRLQRLGYIWIAKLVLSLFILYAGWVPELDFTTSTRWGYDPQRYYQQAQQLVDNGFDSNFVGLNYMGVLYYYGILFALLGHNPVLPALLNLFTTLLATLLLIQVAYEIKSERGANDWRLGFVILVPEILWFDIMTSRETVVMALLTIAALTAGRYWALAGRTSALRTLLLVGITSLGIGVLRTSMILSVAAILGLLFLVLRPSGIRRWAGLLVIGIVAVILAFAPQISESLGSSNFDYAAQLERLSIGDQERLSTLSWDDQSFGQLLIPNNPAQAFLFAFPRAFFYLVTPLPRISLDLAGLAGGDWSAWQSLMMLSSSLLNLAFFPLAIASLVQTIQQRQERIAGFVFHVPFWTLFLAIAGANHIIHDRYRIMATLLLWGCIWLGATMCSKEQIQRSYRIWFMLLGTAGMAYIGYKFLW